MFRDCWDDVALILQEKDFYLWQHRLIWQSLREMIETGENEDVNLISLSTFMEVRKDNLPEDRLTRVGGFAYLAQITKCCYAHSTVTLAREVDRLTGADYGPVVRQALAWLRAERRQFSHHLVTPAPALRLVA